MNLLFVTPYFPPLTHGGIETQVATFARVMARSHGCTIAAPAAGPDELDAYDRVTIYRTRALSPAARDTAGFMRLAGFFDRICEREGIDRILAHNLHTWVAPQVADALHAAAERRGIPVALRAHNFCGPAALRRIEELPWATVLCVSAEAAADLVRAGVRSRHVAVLYPPVDVDRFRPAADRSLRRRLGLAPDRAIVLHASRIVGGTDTLAAKGVPALMAAVSSVKRADLVISFPPPPSWLRDAHANALRAIGAIAARFGIERRLHLITAGHDEMPGVYNGAQVFAMLSELEALGCVYLEAAACGLPVIGKDVGGVREAIEHAVTGFVVADAGAAASALEQLVGDSEGRDRLGRAGGERVRRTFAATRIAAQLERALEDGSDGAH